MDHYLDDSIIEMFFFESEQLIEQMDRAILIGEKSGDFSPELINEILRAMHTIKGSAATMKYANIADLAHSLEDVLHYLREHKPRNINYAELSDLVLDGSDIIKVELMKLKNGDDNDGDVSQLIHRVNLFLEQLKQGPDPLNVKIENTNHSINVDIRSLYAHLTFDETSGMENIRAFATIHHFQEWVEECWYMPSDIVENEDSSEIIRIDGFRVWFRSVETDEVLHQFFSRTSNLKSFQMIHMDTELWNEEVRKVTNRGEEQLLESLPAEDTVERTIKTTDKLEQTNVQNSIISVNVGKLDKLMDLVGELVISEAMVSQNPDLRDLKLDNFMKAARHLQKITSEIQDMVMSIRMVPLTATFNKMQRVVRDMCKKLEKDVQLSIIGEETEVDKNIIERISDPLMHVIRNALDHGIEAPHIRLKNGKDSRGTITLEARNAGSDVYIIIRDDGGGLNKERILDRAKLNGLLTRPEQEMTDKEIYALVFLPGFSTKESVTEFSGRGVGMDVVVSNIEAVGGSVWVESEPGAGSVVYFKIPLTLAIIDGMNIRVGSSRFTIPITAIKESFRPEEQDIIREPSGIEMIMVRGQCYPILRLHDHFQVKNAVHNVSSGIMIMVENETRTFCLFADELIGEQQVVVKTLPDYIRAQKKISGLAGCTLLGDGSISLILDIQNLI